MKAIELLVVLLTLISTGFNAVLAIFNILKYLRIYQLQNKADDTNYEGRNSAENRPKQIAFIPWFVLCICIAVVYTVICTLVVVTLICK